MKIGILTQHFLLNYGGIIQNYALQQVLKKLGHEPLTFEHDTCYGHLRWILRSLKQILYKRSLKGLPARPVYKGRIGNRNFIRFIIKNINSFPVKDFTPAITSRYGIEAYIVGSDQVWRPAFNLGPRLGNMFLDFADDKVRKLAYAASFGCKEWEYSECQEAECRRLARRFDAVSVRETSAVDMCRKHFGVDATLVLDPTLLLDKSDYTKVCHDVPVSQRHVFAYSLVVSDKVSDVAKKIAGEMSVPIILKQAGDKVKADDSIEAWLAEFRDADYVVTDSFHGMVFSIIFNKPFSVVMNPSGGNERYISLLSNLGLMDRIVGDVAVTDDIDWTEVERRLDGLRKCSIDFLTHSLGDRQEG